MRANNKAGLAPRALRLCVPFVRATHLNGRGGRRVAAGSGGDGTFRGGDGIVRRVEFRKDLTVSLLSDRRAFQPYGLAGGQPGARGQTVIKYRGDGRVVNLGGKNTVALGAGDEVCIKTPGGGGYGSPAPGSGAAPAGSGSASASDD